MPNRKSSNIAGNQLEDERHILSLPGVKVWQLQTTLFYGCIRSKHNGLNQQGTQWSTLQPHIILTEQAGKPQSYASPKHSENTLFTCGVQPCPKTCNRYFFIFAQPKAIVSQLKTITKDQCLSINAMLQYGPLSIYWHRKITNTSTKIGCKTFKMF